MALYILDTDILTLFRAGHPEVTRRVRAAPPGEIATTIITAEEQLTGWYTLVRRVTRPVDIERAYARLADTIAFFAALTPLPLTQAAIARYAQLLAAKLNVGKNDLRIAAIALGAGAVVVTRNTRDFGRVPGLVIEDWTQPVAPSPPAPPTAPTP
jgi:tRNA(fMet)-specific endonuclease VapC